MVKCVVSTPVGGCTELLKYGEAGVLAKGFSAKNIFSAIEFAIRNPKVRKQNEQLALDQANFFSLRTSGDRLMQLYEHLLKNKIRYHG